MFRMFVKEYYVKNFDSSSDFEFLNKISRTFSAVVESTKLFVQLNSLIVAYC